MTQNTDLNLPLFERAKAVIPGGVNSPVRAFNAVGGTPRFVRRAQGAHFWDENAQQFTDYIGSWGPMILGHGHPEVMAAVQAAALEGFSFGAPTEREVVLAEKILSLMPSMDMVRMVSSGTEAGMSALRLARGFTGRNKIIKFNGCYHGHADALLVKAGSGLATFGASSSAGVPQDVVKDTVVLEYNDVGQIEEAFAQFGGEIACVIMEPIAGNMNFVRASVEFTRRIRELTREHGALMVYDEVMTGFRVALGSAQSLYAQQIEGFAPDITVLGKVIGGGMPMAAFGARREIMEKLSPLGPVYQAGTLSGNPIATACGLKTLELISEPGFHEALHARTGRLMAGLKAEADAAGVPFSVDHQGGLFGFYLLPELPSTWSEVMKTDGARFNRFFHGMLERGHYFAPALYEAGFVSAAHTDADIDKTVEAAREVFRTL
ncbi:Glutamate-1-semialdehyde 2,1-aminomutase [Delftia tsuruhatensis]|uniref:glutamate-1-semialdehyde 2,1-aminomutase n=1 Tax=Delftia tsuruhatensis TaxID=180282 RepID=UPI001E6EBC4D|nr:glutamate-1-semialdehyde 2,1-aminomutase [Delftia tsuruhatensis]CAB5702390.1 Glutamate-1-semialdehyde 2,1-aminomutase [Delftia tsuruhatensis]CAC9691227.1 Glutamate-1-semialdehyde 2,1-aminomutase [Delftia tsuruhatensis]